MVWFIVCSIYLITYEGNSETMCKYMYKIIPSEQTSLKMKLLWLMAPFSRIIITCSFGIISKYNYWLNIIVISVMLYTSVYETEKFYHKQMSKLS